MIIAIFLIPQTLADNQTNQTNQTTQENSSQVLPIITFSIETNQIQLGQNAQIAFSIDYPDEILKIKIEYGNQDADYLSVSTNNQYSLSYKYEKKGEYNIKVTVYPVNTDPVSKLSPTIIITEPEIPDEKPSVNLIYPKENALIKKDKETFKFSANDDKKLTKCLFEVYLNDGEWKTLEYNQTITNPEKNKEYSIPLKEFDDANYTWYVTCTDNSSQEKTKKYDFAIKTVMHEREKELLSLLEEIDSFSEKTQTLPPEEKSILETLGILKDTKYYKKRLIQINQDLGNNIKFISDPTLREKRKIETIEEYENIKENIPTDIKIIKSKNYIKNSLSTPMLDITNQYIEAKKIQLSKNKVKKLSKSNELFQEKIRYETDITQIEIINRNTSRDITMIKKKIQLSDDSTDYVFELIPFSQTEKPKFITKSQEISKNLYQINKEDIEDDQIIYYFEKIIDESRIKTSETFLFKEFKIKGIDITGFSIINSDINSNPYIFVAILLIISSISYFFIYKKYSTKIKLHPSWKKNINVPKTLKLTDEPLPNP